MLTAIISGIKSFFDFDFNSFCIDINNTVMQKNYPKIYYFINEINLSDLSKLGKDINIIYRNYEGKLSHNNLLILKKFCQVSKRKLFISNDIQCALKLKKLVIK